MRSRIWLCGQATVTIVLLALLARDLDLAAFRALFVRLPLWFYLVSLGVVLGGQVAYAWRWRLLLSAAGIRAPFGLVLRYYFIGIFVSNFLPSTIGGDMAKVYYVGRDHGFRVVAASVAMDRLLGVGLLAMLATVAIVMSPVSSPRLTAAAVACAAVTAGVIVALAVTSIGTGGLPKRVARFGPRAAAVAARLQRLRLDMAAPLARPVIVWKATAVVLTYATAVAAVYARFVVLQGGTTPPFVAMFAVVTATTVLSNVPISLNGLGLREQLHAALLAPLGIRPELAVAISLLFFAHLLVASLVGWWFWLQAPAASPEMADAP